MSRKFITLVSAAAVAVAGLTAGPADALDKRTRNAILGVAALAILGAAASQANSDNGYVPRRDDDPYPRSDHDHGHWHGYGVHPRPVPPRVIFSELPDRCAFTVRTRGGPARMFETRCLQRNYSHANRLPNICRRTVKLGSEQIDAYGGACLRERSGRTARLYRR